MIQRLTLFGLVWCAWNIQAQPAKPSAGRIQRFENFSSAFVTPRNVDVWLPNDYDATKRYDVLYMHDGQMLFDAATTWNHQEWGVDETMDSLSRKGKIRDCIVVGIWNTGAMRHSEYFPQKPFESLTVSDQTTLQDAINGNNPSKPFDPISDRYLKFLVTELKPFIDSHFATRKNRKSTFIAGSSMGGLISLYAICEYPAVFGGAACLSTHWPGIFRNENNPFPVAMLDYLKKNLPNPKTNRIYFDHGSETLDSMYAVTQVKVDALMRKKGSSCHWQTSTFPGEDHSESAWRKRLGVPIAFLLSKLDFSQLRQREENETSKVRTKIKGHG